MAILNVYINFTCQHFLRNKLLASKVLANGKSTCQHPCPTAFRMEVLQVTNSHTSGYIHGLLNLSLLSRWEGWIPMLGVHKGSLLGEGVSYLHFDSHSHCVQTGGLQAFLWLSAVTCVCTRNTVCGNLEEGCLRKNMSWSPVSQPFALFWEWQRSVWFSGALVKRRVEWLIMEGFSSLVIFL